MIDTVLFDLDGTLCDTNELIIETVDYIFKNFIKEHKLTRDEYIKFIGPTLYESFGWYVDDKDYVDFLVKEYRKKNIELHDSYVKPFDGAYELLKSLKNEGYQLGVVSSKLNEMVRRGLRVSGIDSVFDVIVGLDDVKNHKPHEEPILKALSQFDCVKGAIYVGDHQNDILAAKNASIMSCGLLYSLHKDSLLKANADYYVSSLLELKEVLKHV